MAAQQKIDEAMLRFAIVYRTDWVSRWMLEHAGGVPEDKLTCPDCLRNLAAIRKTYRAAMESIRRPR